MPEAALDTDTRNRDRNSSDTANRLRVRATWLYHVEGMTQSDVAKKLGVNRIMVTRLLAEAKKRGEVVINIKSELSEVIELQQKLEAEYGLARAIVAPFDDPQGDPTKVIAYAAGTYVSEIMQDNLTVGVGWGRTLHAMLPYIDGRSLDDVRIVSLLGGIAQARRFNPAEFAWQFAELFNAEGYLISAPAIVDSVETRHALLEHCGLDEILKMAQACDIALISCGGIGALTTSYRLGHVSESERLSMIEAGAIGDVLYNFLDKDGQPVDHPVNSRSISMSMERLKRVPNKVLVSGGQEKLDILRASLSALKPSVLVTDEQTARQLVDA